MIIWATKLLFGKVIGLDSIPKEHKQKAAELAVTAIKNLNVTYDPKTKGVKVGVKKAF